MTAALEYAGSETLNQHVSAVKSARSTEAADDEAEDDDEAEAEAAGGGAALSIMRTRAEPGAKRRRVKWESCERDLEKWYV